MHLVLLFPFRLSFPFFHILCLCFILSCPSCPPSLCPLPLPLPDQRIDLRGEDFQWRILDRLLAHADGFYRELGTRKREAPVRVPKFGRKVRKLDAW